VKRSKFPRTVATIMWRTLKPTVVWAGSRSQVVAPKAAGAAASRAAVEAVVAAVVLMFSVSLVSGSACV
jgi:hypothetical protein